ncbi:hypothetical protein FD754_000111, partial [Muntiacus muntjak]
AQLLASRPCTRDSHGTHLTLGASNCHLEKVEILSGGERDHLHSGPASPMGLLSFFKQPVAATRIVVHMALELPVHSPGKGEKCGNQYHTITGRCNNQSGLFPFLSSWNPGKRRGGRERRRGCVNSSRRNLSPPDESSTSLHVRELVSTPSSPAEEVSFLSLSLSFPVLTPLPPRTPPNDPHVTYQPDCISLFHLAQKQNQVGIQINGLTSFVDACMLYGSEVALAMDLCNQTNFLGLLSLSTHFQDNGQTLLPFVNLQDDSAVSPTARHASLASWLVRLGDGHETPKLAVMHTRLATELKCLNRWWNGDKLCQQARKIMGAMVQIGILPYRDFLPLVLGENRARKTMGPSWGHTTLQPFMFCLDSQYQASAPNSRVPLSSAFFASWQIVQDGWSNLCYSYFLTPSGIDPFLQGLMATTPTKLNPQDSRFVMSSRTGCFGYNAWRCFCELSRPQNLAKLSWVLKNDCLARKFLYLHGTPDNTNQGVFTERQHVALSHISLSQTVCDNPGITPDPRDIFRASSTLGALCPAPTSPA